MNTESWHILSDWHSAWLAAAIGQRDELRAAFAIAHPELLQAADELAAASADIGGFLETPAMVLAARELVEEAPTLPEGTQVGPYRVVALLARGGMGDVYRATDPRLGRDVALKTLTSAERGTRDAVERFLQEGRITASLDHPNIVKVFDVGMSDERPFLVSELLDGETLRASIDRGPVAAESARAIACAVASGLAAAHARGLVHRDLKPENIFLTRSGSIKILDFGIAKLVQDPALPRGLATLTGVLLGTAGYLAPEQVRGDAVDARTDLFALGSILFELLTGERAFVRAHTIDTLHAIVHHDPPDLLLEGSPLTAIATRLLAKAPHDRFQSADDLRWYLERLETSSGHERSKPLSGAGRSISLRRVAAIAAGVGLLVFVATLVGRRLLPSPQPVPAADLVQFTWALPAGTTLDSAPIVSPDGRRLAFTAVERDLTPRLFVRSLDSKDATVLAGTDGAMRPFWSPDGTALGYFAGGKLMRVAIAGGVPVSICDAPAGMGGAWSPNGTIVFSPQMISEGLARVSASGGPVEPATVLDLAHGENSHRWPAFLPDGVHFLYHVRSSADERRGVYIGRIDQTATTPGVPVFRSESGAVFVATLDGHRGVLLSAADGHVQARPFDASTLRLEGDPRSLPVAAAATTPYHAAMLSASPERLAAVAIPIPFGGQLGIVARNGGRTRLLERRQQNWPRLSPEGARIARQLIDPLQGNPDIWVEDLRDGSLVRVTTDLGSDIFPVWSPDGSKLAYASGPLNDRRLSIAAADGTGVLRDVPCPDAYCEPTDWLPDGRGLIVTARRAAGFAGAGDIWRVSLDVGAPAAAILAGPLPEYDGRLSADGRWLAYVSDDGGRPDVFIGAMTGQPRRLVVSSNGGSQPVWRRDGREIFYVDREGLLQARAVEERPDGGLSLGAAVVLNVPRIGPGHWGTQYDVSSDGQSVYFIDRTLPAGPSGIDVVIGWRMLLEE